MRQITICRVRGSSLFATSLSSSASVDRQYLYPQDLIPAQGDKILFCDGDVRVVVSQNGNVISCGDVLLNLKGSAGDRASFLTVHANDTSRGSTQNAINNAFGNPNLVFNPHFSINQKGQTTYTSGESVDCWFVGGQNASLSKNSDGSVSLSGNSFSFSQTLNKSARFFGKVYTLSFCANGVVYNASQTVNSQSGDYCVINVGGATACLRVDQSGVVTILFQGSSLRLDWVKLEEGNVATKCFDNADSLEKLKIKAQSLCNLSVVQEGDVLKITL